MSESNASVYCPVCATGRNLPVLKLPWFRILLWSGMWAAGIGGSSALLWGPAMALWSTLLSAVLSFTVFEVYYVSKFRRELVCPICHFDPVLYRKSPERAKEQCMKNLQMQQDAFLAKWQVLRQARSRG